MHKRNKGQCSKTYTTRTCKLRRLQFDTAMPPRAILQVQLIRPLRNQPPQPHPGVRQAICTPRLLNLARLLVNSPGGTQSTPRCLIDTAIFRSLEDAAAILRLNSSRTVTSSVATPLSTSQSFCPNATSFRNPLGTVLGFQIGSLVQL
jgi:hypothetical protein